MATLLLPWLQLRGAFGPNQYAYSKGRGHKDVLAVNVCSWLLAPEEGDMVGVYCSDVSRAFDRVSRVRLGDKLRRFGLHPELLCFLCSWLEDRSSEVVVGGCSSGREPLCDRVFQGTVLGPPLWNTQYADAREATSSLSFTETVFADDDNCWVRMRKGLVPQDIRCEIALRGAQRELHAWGRANQVVFDRAKNSLHILHRRLGTDGEFKILGVIFQSQLLFFFVYEPKPHTPI